MIPRQSNQISFCDEFTQTLEKVPALEKIVQAINHINSILCFITLSIFIGFDSESENILRSNQNENMTMLYGKFGYDMYIAGWEVLSYLVCYISCLVLFVLFCPCFDYCVLWHVSWGFILKIFGAGNSILPAYPYLKDQIIGPDYRIIQCDRIDSLGSWQDQWCTHHQNRIILSWLLIFVWLMPLFFYLSISLLIALLILCKRSYRISKLWVVYQYQYRKGLFLTWLKEQKEKSRQQMKPAIITNVKSDTINKDINNVEVFIIR